MTAVYTPAEFAALEERVYAPFRVVAEIMGMSQAEVAASQVYFVSPVDSGLVKIGYARCVESRVASLRMDNHVPLRVLALLIGGKDQEKELHARFRPYRVRGEWFRIEGELKKRLDRVAEKVPKETLDEWAALAADKRRVGWS